MLHYNLERNYILYFTQYYNVIIIITNNNKTFKKIYYNKFNVFYSSK